MHWRWWGALAVLGVGWAIGLTDLAERTPRDDRKYVSAPAQYETAVRKARRLGEYPIRGTIGYRDELHPDTAAAQSDRNQVHLLFQYAFAPVLLDRAGRHDLTLVLTPTNFHLERARSKP